MGVWVVLLVWLVATRLLLRQLSLQMCHKSRCLLVWLLCCHHLLPHALLQQKDDTANNAVDTFRAKPVMDGLGHQVVSCPSQCSGPGLITG